MRTLIEEMNDYWAEFGKDEPLEAFQRSRQLVIEESRDGGQLDPETGDFENINGVYSHLFHLCRNRGMPPLADTIMREWWKDWGARQYRLGKKLHRAWAAFHLSILFLETGDHGME